MVQIVFGVSGTPPPSGIVSPTGTRQTGTTGGPVYSGYWAIEFQSLEIEYHRTPTYIYEIGADASGVAKGNLMLGGPDIRTFMVSATHVNSIANPVYSLTKVYGTYDTPYFLQMQKFAVLPQADQYGQTYGSFTGSLFTGATGTGFSGLIGAVMGPKGKIMTVQPYIQRTTWDPAIHTETSQTAEGTNAVYFLKNYENKIISFQHPNTQNNLGDYKFEPKVSLEPGAYKVWANTHRTVFYNDYYMSSFYSTTGEHPLFISSFIDTIGNRARSLKMLKTVIPFALVNTQPTSIFDVSYLLQDKDALTGVPGYSILRHNYS